MLVLLECLKGLKNICINLAIRLYPGEEQENTYIKELDRDLLRRAALLKSIEASACEAFRYYNLAPTLRPTSLLEAMIFDVTISLS
jgi:hypothetical protein